MRAIGRHQSAGCGRSPLRTGALVTLLLLGACLMATTIGCNDGIWIRGFALMPLLLVIRLGRPVEALSAGVLWGISVCVFSLRQADPVMDPSTRLLLSLAAAPGIYAYLATRLTGWIGFSPFVLGIGWMGVEIVLEPVGVRAGLLGGLHGEGTVLNWVGEAFGWVLVAFLFALLNASLVSLLNRAWTDTRCERTQRPDRGAPILPQTLVRFPVFPIRSSGPRGPPTPRSATITTAVM